MNGKYQVLICKVCNYYLGFELNSIHQIIRVKKVKKDLRRGIIEFREKKIPYFNIFQFLNCNDTEGKFFVILEQKGGLFATPVSEIEGIIQSMPNLGENVAEGLRNFLLKDYVKSVTIFNDLPVMVVDTEKLKDDIMEKREMGKTKER